MQHETHHEEAVEKTSGIPIIGVAIILAILAIFLLSYFKNDANGVTKGNIWDIKNGTVKTGEKEEGEMHEEAATMVKPESLGKLDSASGNFIYNVGEITKLKLPDSTFITAGENSTEAKLIKFLSDASLSVDTANKSNGWISCDRLYFETGKSTITAESQNQLKNIAAILKAFPIAMVKIGGYTDSTGSAETNKKVSEERADAASASLIKLGTGTERLKAEGYGPEYPIASNSTPEGRALNRRIDLRVTKK
jgi:OOP family OmpA-OmpF porin